MRSDPVRVKHGFPPVYDWNSKVLVLGSMPSPRSRERGFYYMHPQNRFWRMLAEVLGEELPSDIPGRRDMCISHGVALWDVLAECTISGASDSSITDPVPNPLEEVFRAADIRGVPSVHKPCKQDNLRGENAREIPQDCHGAGIPDIKKSDGSSPSDFFLRVDQ